MNTRQEIAWESFLSSGGKCSREQFEACWLIHGRHYKLADQILSIKAGSYTLKELIELEKKGGLVGIFGEVVERPDLVIEDNE